MSLLKESAKSRGSVVAEIGRDNVMLTVETAQAAAGTLKLRGRWRTPDFRGAVLNEVSAKLLLPFMFRISRICLPASEIVYLRKESRSLADFFARNVFFAILRNVPVACDESAMFRVSMPAINDMQRQYFFILKSKFSEPVFQNREEIVAIDLILANAYAPVIQFQSHLLQEGGQKWRQTSRREGSQTEPAALKSRLKEARARVLSYYSD